MPIAHDPGTFWYEYSWVCHVPYTAVPLGMGIHAYWVGCRAHDPVPLGMGIHAYWVGCRAHSPGTLGYENSWILGMLLWYLWVWGFPGY